MWLAKAYGYGYNPENYNIVHIPCDSCGKIIEREQWRINAHNKAGNIYFVCSKECRNILNSRLDRRINV